MNSRTGTLRRLLRLVAPAGGGIALNALMSFVTIAAGIGLMATAAYAIARAALATSFVEIEAGLAGVRVFAISRGAFRYLDRYVAHSVSLRLLARLRVWFYAAIEPLAPAVLWRHRSGDVLARIVSDIETLEQFSVRVLAPAAAALLVAVVAGLFLAVFDPRLALVLLAAMALIGLVGPATASHAGRRAASQQTAARAELSAVMVDSVQGLADLLATGQEARQLSRLAETGARLEQAERRLALLRGLGAGSAALLSSLALLAVLVIAVSLVSQGRLDAVYLGVLPLAAIAGLEAALPLSTAIEHLERSLAAGDRLFELADADAAVPEPANPARPPSGETIDIRNLRFAYNPGEPPVLDGLSFGVGAGERVAILGPSGAGKTTLLNLLLRFWDFQEGEVRIGDRDSRQCAADDVRALFAVVAQDTHLFAGTIRTNLLLARPQASPEDLVAACSRARLHDSIERLPRGYDTWIGESGRLLSGGERQRLAIARAILKDAPILILDEPTAHLDPGTAAEVLSGLEGLMQGRTVLVLGHDGGFLGSAGRILSLEGGRLRAAPGVGSTS